MNLPQALKEALSRTRGEVRLVVGSPPSVEVEAGRWAVLGQTPIGESELVAFMGQHFSQADLAGTGMAATQVGLGGAVYRLVKQRINGRLAVQVLPRAMERSSAGDSQPGLAPQSLTDLLEWAIEHGASDLHLSSGTRPRVRVDGAMAAVDDRAPMRPEVVESALQEIMPGWALEEFTERKDTDFAYALGETRFRVNVFCDRNGMGAVFRLIPSRIPGCEELGIPPSLTQLCSLQKGLVLVTGPTGSGKSTTLAALIDEVNRTRDDHIITIEDPIEYVHPNKRCLVNQREVGRHTQGFQAALRAALREDPDVVLVGELRDLETTAMAIETAETGHLVFGTLHTMDATSTVDRIVGQFPAAQQEQIRLMLSETLRAVVAQTLCRRSQGGRVAAREILLHNRAVANLIREGKTFQLPSLIQTSGRAGMVTMQDALVDLVRRRLISIDEARRHAPDPERLTTGEDAPVHRARRPARQVG